MICLNYSVTIVNPRYDSMKIYVKLLKASNLINLFYLHGKSELNTDHFELKK